MTMVRYRVPARVPGLAVALGAVVVCLMACGSTGTSPTSSAASAPGSVASATSAPASPSTNAVETVSSVAPKPSKTTARDTSTRVIKVPNGVGLDYQSAQDLWRAAGLHVAPATDATGAHRLPLIDANWVVLGQDLKAGSKVPADSFITATVKKFSDS